MSKLELHIERTWRELGAPRAASARWTQAAVRAAMDVEGEKGMESNILEAQKEQGELTVDLADEEEVEDDGEVSTRGMEEDPDEDQEPQRLESMEVSPQDMEVSPR